MKTVAISYKKDGSCEKVGEIKNLYDTDYNKLVREAKENEKQELKEKEELVEKVNALEEEIENLKQEIKVLKGEEE